VNGVLNSTTVPVSEVGDFHRNRTQITGSHQDSTPLYLYMENLFGGHTMNTDQLQGKWKQLKGSIKERWGKLTDDDIDVINGKNEQLVGKIQEKYGIAKEEAQRQVDEWMRADAQTQTDDFEKRRAS
jgi:uncharacterized protein YjbJ (UPF0337 family)